MPIKIKDLEELKNALDLITEKFGTRFYINVEYSLEDLPESLKNSCIELDVE